MFSGLILICVDANDIDITQSVHKWNYVATSPVQTSHGEQLKPVGAEKGSLANDSFLLLRSAATVGL